MGTFLENGLFFTVLWTAPDKMFIALEKKSGMIPVFLNDLLILLHVLPMQQTVFNFRF